MRKKHYILVYFLLILSIVLCGCSDAQRIKNGVPQEQVAEDVYPEVWNEAGAVGMWKNYRIGGMGIQFPYKELVEESIEKCTHNIDKKELTDTVIIEGCFENLGQTRVYRAYAYYRYDGETDQWWLEGITVQ